MAELTMGMLRLKFLETLLLVSTSLGSILDIEGTSRKSSNVNPSGALFNLSENITFFLHSTIFLGLKSNSEVIRLD